MTSTIYYTKDSSMCMEIANDADSVGCSVQLNINVSLPTENYVRVEGSHTSMAAFSRIRERKADAALALTSLER